MCHTVLGNYTLVFFLGRMVVSSQESSLLDEEERMEVNIELSLSERLKEKLENLFDTEESMLNNFSKVKRESPLLIPTRNFLDE